MPDVWDDPEQFRGLTLVPYRAGIALARGTPDGAPLTTARERSASTVPAGDPAPAGPDPRRVQEGVKAR